jgi:5-methylcytosine-specific restriction endonuclease McrA
MSKGDDLGAEEYLENEKLRLTCHGHAKVPILCKRINATGFLIAGFQCGACGCWKAVKKAFVKNLDALPDYDESISRRYFDSRSAAHNAEIDAEKAKWWADYNAYLRTEKWAKKRAAVLERDKRTCQACLTRPATQAHHTTYAHVFDEPLFELVAVCEPCHEKITEMDRKRWAKPVAEEQT